MNELQIFGYVASVLVAISLMMSSIVKLRIINLIGAACFSLYGFLIGAYPVFALNGFIALIDIYYLVQIFGAKEYFRIIEVQTNSEYLNYFLKFYNDDIKNFIPTFNYTPNQNYHAMFVLRDTIPAGLVISEYLDDDVIYLKLDYAIPGYRDFKMGKYVFNEIFKTKKVKKIYSDPGNKKHQYYLKKMGFEKCMLDNNEIYCMNVNNA
ncbi:MAG: hypothetical protein N2321_00260 [Melioribacteraceae bacterium]|nr:hypothetical protein [Melioribacteraceae bacterium]